MNETVFRYSVLSYGVALSRWFFTSEHNRSWNISIFKMNSEANALKKAICQLKRGTEKNLLYPVRLESWEWATRKTFKRGIEGHQFLLASSITWEASSFPR